MGALKYEWWNQNPKDLAGPEVVAFVKSVSAETKSSSDTSLFDSKSRKKVAGYFLSAFAILGVNFLAGTPVWLQIPSIILLGVFIIPFTRAYMHSQMHWKIGGSPFMNFIYDHGISLLYSLPQTSYVNGHRMHHRFDNDWSPDGRPKDLQSTYMFSKTMKPLNMFLWIPYCIFAFQLFLTSYITLKSAPLREKVWLVLEWGIIFLFHFGIYKLSSDVYFHVYLPSLGTAWFVAVVTLYMQHAVSADNYSVHPSNTCVNPFFNTFADDDGYHLEHSLFPQLHHKDLHKIHGVLKYDAHQTFKRFYFGEGLLRLFRGG